MPSKNVGFLSLSQEQLFFIQKLVSFFIVSCIGLVINTITFIIMLDGVPEVIPIYPLLLEIFRPENFLQEKFWNRLWEFFSVGTAILVTTLWNFTLNKLWTFRSQGQDKKVTVQTTQYLIVGAIGAVENLGIYGILTFFYPEAKVISEIIAFIVSVISNFLLNNYWTFASSPGEEKKFEE
ncbi:MAG: GtrA family protein [Candidatus Odinarchaeota archaeon]